MEQDNTQIEYQYIAVIFQKLFNRDNIYAFIPYVCAEVSLGEINTIYWDDYKLYPIEISHIVVDTTRLYFGFLISREELQEKYGSEITEETLRSYLKNFDRNLYLGLDKGTGKLEICSLSLETFHKMSQNNEQDNNNSDTIGEKQFTIVPINHQE